MHCHHAYVPCHRNVCWSIAPLLIPTVSCIKIFPLRYITTSFHKLSTFKRSYALFESNRFVSQRLPTSDNLLAPKSPELFPKTFKNHESSKKAYGSHKEAYRNTDSQDKAIIREEEVRMRRRHYHAVIRRRRGPTSNYRDFRYVSLRSLQPSRIPNVGNALDDIDTSWFSNYAVIAVQRQALQLLPRTERHIWPRMITSDMSTQQMLEIWQNIYPRYVRNRWQNYMLWALQHSPEMALKLLDIAISHSTPKIPRQIVEDCLNYLAAIFLESVSSPDPSKLQYIYRLTCNFVEASCQGELGRSSINQKTVYLILAHCSNEQAEILYRMMCDHGTEIYSFTLLHFLTRFCDMGKSLLCVDVIQKITECRIDSASTIVQCGIAKILRSRHDENWSKFSSLILAESLRMGIRPTILTYNAMILNSVEAGDYDKAFHLYELAQEYQLKPDAMTYRVLLKGCRESMDRENLVSVFRDIETDDLLIVDNRLIFDMLYASFKIEINKDWHSIFTNLLPIYTKYYDSQPLQELGLIDIEPSLQPLEPPSTRALGIILIAYIRQYSQSPDVLCDLYQRYWDFVKQGHPLIAPMAATTHIADTLILAFGRKLHTLEMCTTIIKSMLEHEQASSTLESSNSSEAAGPTVYTWSILVMSFSRHGQMVAAEKVLSMMKDRGIEPNHITWNHLIHGYAKAQDIDQAINSIKRLEVEGYSIDDYTLAGLGKLKDRDMLIKALNNAIEDDTRAIEPQETDEPEYSTKNSLKHIES